MGEGLVRFFVTGALCCCLWAAAPAQGTNDLVFIHHSSGLNWLNGGLEDALAAKDYLDERNDIYYDTELSPDPGRPESLGPPAGDYTDMRHWLFWFNDYLDGVKIHGCEDGVNTVIMFKSCFPTNNIGEQGELPGEPFAWTQTVTNFQAVYRHAAGPGNTYNYGGHTYRPLEHIFAENPGTLFIPVTAPPLNYLDSGYNGSSDGNAARARAFNNWLKNEWLAAYNAAHPGLNNVAVFDWFDGLAYPDDDPDPGHHPNRLRDEYILDWAPTDSHINPTAAADTAVLFAAGADNFLDAAWAAFMGTGEGEGEGACDLEGACPDFDEEGGYAYGALALDYATADLDATGIPDSWEVALFKAVLCGPGHPLQHQARCVFLANREMLRQEAAYAADYAAVENVLAAGLSISSELQAALTAAFGMSASYEVVSDARKAPGEPFSPQGDPDWDAWTGWQEYANTVGAGLSRTDYVTAALHVLLDGSQRAADALPVNRGLGPLVLAGMLSALSVMALRRRGA